MGSLALGPAQEIDVGAINILDHALILLIKVQFNDFSGRLYEQLQVICADNAGPSNANTVGY